MKNRNTLLSICTLSICLFGFSQNDQRARLLLNQLSETYATFESMYIEFEYLLERGVSPSFAIDTLKAGADGMWYPRRKQLLEAGVLTE